VLSFWVYGRFLRINTVANATAIMIATAAPIMVVVTVPFIASKLIGVAVGVVAGA
jgi:hypothetical protein